MCALPLQPPVLALLADLIEQKIGLHYSQDAALLGDKVSARALEAGFESLLDYYYYLRYDDPEGAEFDRLVEALVVGETYFFRELEPLQTLVDEFLAPRAKDRPLRVWCAAASTGEEPLTLAMLLADRQLLDRVDVLATDISASALDRARQGCHGRRSLRQPPPPSLARWIRETGPTPVVNPALVAAVRWQRVNLLDAGAIGCLGSFDAIICRNVLIYFRDAIAARVVRSLESALRPDGVLLVGVSESLVRIGTSLTRRERRGYFFYERTR